MKAVEFKPSADIKAAFDVALKDADNMKQVIIIWEDKDGFVKHTAHSKSILRLSGMLNWVEKRVYELGVEVEVVEPDYE